MSYANYFSNRLSSTTESNMFADDTNISPSGAIIDDICEHLNSDLDKIHQRLPDNKLTLNKDKTEYMIIASAQRILKT